MKYMGINLTEMQNLFTENLKTFLPGKKKKIEKQLNLWIKRVKLLKMTILPKTHQQKNVNKNFIQIFVEINTEMNFKKSEASKSYF